MNLKEMFAVLTPDLGVQPVAVGPGLYEDLDRNFDGFRGHVLVSTFEFDGDWPTWERHPAGDEIVVLLSGSARMLLKTGNGDRQVDLSEPGEYLIVPRNTWHTARISSATRMLFVTPGEGTENQSAP